MDNEVLSNLYPGKDSSCVHSDLKTAVLSRVAILFVVRCKENNTADAFYDFAIQQENLNSRRNMSQVGGL